MSSSDEVREALIDMGVDPAKSHAASTMFGSVDAAINWVFGEGENVSLQLLVFLADEAVAATSTGASSARLCCTTAS